jgi:hypothetical protein
MGGFMNTLNQIGSTVNGWRQDVRSGIQNALGPKPMNPLASGSQLQGQQGGAPGLQQMIPTTVGPDTGSYLVNKYFGGGGQQGQGSGQPSYGP